MKIYLLVIIVLANLLNTYQAKSQPPDTSYNFKKHYDHYKVDGSFMLYDQKNDKFIVYNESRLKEQYSPASTFKILNSLIGLETGVIKDEHFVIQWDSTVRQNSRWNKDHDLKTAYKNSTVWYYQELARRVGPNQMKVWLDKVDYGNADTSGGVDRFWLFGGLRISPEQQMDFLRKLYTNQLPFSKRTVDIVKEIMIEEKTSDYTISSKTGWADEEKRMIGWYIGFIETAGNVYYFVNCIQSSDLENSGFAAARNNIVHRILEDMNILKRK